MTFHSYEETTPDHFQPGAERRMAYTENLMMVIFDFHDGPKAEPDPPHSHPHEQISSVVAGEIIFFLGDESQHMQPGDMVTIPANVPHSIQLLTEHVRLVDAFTPIREDFLA